MALPTAPPHRPCLPPSNERPPIATHKGTGKHTHVEQTHTSSMIEPAAIQLDSPCPTPPSFSLPPFIPAILSCRLFLILCRLFCSPTRAHSNSEPPRKANHRQASTVSIDLRGSQIRCDCRLVAADLSSLQQSDNDLSNIVSIGYRKKKPRK